MLARILRYICFFLITSIQTYAAVNAHIKFENDAQYLKIGNKATYFIDKSNSLTIHEIIHKNFVKTDQPVPNFGIQANTIWIRITVQNLSQSNNLIIEVAQPTLDKITFYHPTANNKYTITKMG